MATVRGGSVARPVILACLALTLYGAVSTAGVTQHDRHGPSLHRLSSGGGALPVDGRHRTDVSESSSAGHWKLLARRLNAVLRMMSKHPSDDAASPDCKLNRVLRALQGGVRRRRDVPESPSAGHWKRLVKRLHAVLRMMRSQSESDNAPSSAIKQNRVRISLRDGVRHRRDVSESSSAGHWKLLARRLNAVLRMMRSRKPAHASDDVLSSDMKPKRVRRSYEPADQVAQEQQVADDIRQVVDEYGPGRNIAQQQEVAREVEQVERDAGVPSDEEKLEQEEEIMRDIKQVEAQYGPAHKIAQQKEIAREIEEAEIQAGRADADRKFEQQREIQREIGEIERKARRPSDAEKLEQEREIARQIEEIEAQARATQVAREREIAGNIHAIVDAHLARKRRPGSAFNDDDSSSEESQESSEGTGDVDDDPVYDDSFGDDSSSVVSPLGENGDDDILSPNDEPSSSDAVAAATDDATAGAQGQVKDAAPGQGHAQVAHASWQVTAMTVVMCSIVGIVLLIVVGAWYRDLGFRPFRPGKPEQLLLDDDEQTVYNRTTQPEPRQVGRYSPLT